MITDNYCHEYRRSQVMYLLELVGRSSRYDRVEIVGDKITLSCSGAFRKTFSAVEPAIKYLNKIVTKK